MIRISCNLTNNRTNWILYHVKRMIILNGQMTKKDYRDKKKSKMKRNKKVMIQIHRQNNKMKKYQRREKYRSRKYKRRRKKH